MDYLDKALFPDFKSLLRLVDKEPGDKRHKAITLAANGNLDSGASLLTKYLKEKSTHDLETRLGELSYRLDCHVNGLIVGLFGNAYVMRRKHMPKAAIDLFCAAADLHYEDAAYNAANSLLYSSGTPSDILLAEKYFLQAIEDTDDPSKKSAALVNYAEIVRDGMVTGKPDYPGAIAIYEQAAKLGLVTAMFNVGNVAMWMQNKNDESQVPKGIYWLTKLHEHFISNKPFLEMDQSNVSQAFLDSALDMLVKFHVLSDCPEADSEAGLSLLLAQPETTESSKGRQWMIEQAMIKRLRKSCKPVLNTPGHNWKHVLCQLGWICWNPDNHPEMHAEYFKVETSGHGDIYFVVMNGLFDLERPSVHALRAISHMHDQGMHRLLLAPSHALFRHYEDRIYTPVMVVNESSVGTGFIGLDGGADATFKSIDGSTDNQERVSTDSCVISIAINRLNEGLSLHGDLDLDSRFGGFGNWGLPYKSEAYVKTIPLI